MTSARSVLASVLVLALATSASAQEPGTPPRLDPRAEAAVVEFARGVADDLLGAVRGEGPAAQALKDRALDPTQYADELAHFVRVTTGAGEVVGVDAVGFDLRAVLWLGFVPLGAAELNFHVGPQGVSLVRLQAHDAEVRLFGFLASGGPEWQGDLAAAFGLAAQNILDDVVQGRCQTLPMLAVDAAGTLPDDEATADRMRQTLARLERQSIRSCKELTGRVFERLTWRLGRLSMVVSLADGTKLPFEQELTAGPDGQVRLGHLTAPRR